MPREAASIDGQEGAGGRRASDPPGLTGRWRVGKAELDESGGCLIVSGQRHPLDRSGWALLRRLLQGAGEVVTKDELLAAGWPGRVVSENSLAKAIGRLRLALDDPQGAVLCTVHGYGYRLVVGAEFADRQGPSVPPPQPTPAPRTIWRWLALPALLATVVTFSLPDATAPRHAAAPVAAPVAASAPALAPMASIAVLPFADMSQAQDQGYFSDGLADELLDQLAKLPQLRVAGRTSSFSFRGTQDDVASIGRKLNVATVLEGSVRKSGDRIRITVQLIQVADGFHLWSETYDRKMVDLFAVQDEIARAVVEALQLKLLPGQTEAVTQHRTASPQAFAEFLRGSEFEQRGKPDDERRAIGAYRRAIAFDPKFAGAYVRLANILGGDAEYADTPADVVAGKTESLAMMDKAIEADPRLADTYLARADMLYSTNWDWAGAQRDLDKAVSLGAGNSVHYLVLQSRLLCAFGRVADAIELERRAAANDPLSSAWGSLGYHYAAVGNYPMARQSLGRALRLFPMDDHANFYLGLTDLLEGKPAEAVRDFDRGGSVFRLAGLAAAQYSAGDQEASQRALDALIAKYANTGAYQVAEVYSWRGDADQAFAWLDRAYAQRDAGLIHLKFDPMMRPLRTDPRYRAWLQKMGLPD